MKSALIIGCGYTGTRLATRLMDIGMKVAGTTRSGERAAELEASGVEPLVGGLQGRELLLGIDKVCPDLIVYFVPPQVTDADPLGPVLASLARSPLEAFVYVSSTAVYGNRDGEWVDESTTVRPGTPVARARCQAERIVIDAARTRGTPTRVCRVTGIYGPERTLKKLLQSGNYVLIRDHDAWVNRIHVDDLASGLVAAWQAGGAAEVYNLTDDEPHRTSEFAFMAADLHGLPRPRIVDAKEAAELLGEERLRRKLDSKRVRNRRMREELGVQLEFPSYKIGLPSAVAEEQASGP